VSQPATAPDVSHRLRMLAFCVPQLIAPDAKVQVGIHLDDAETFDAIIAEYGNPEVRVGGGTESCPHHFLSARININGQEVTVYQADDYGRSVIDVTVTT